jgi:hypothetical protein
LSLSASTGTISGTPTGAVNHAPLVLQVRDSGNPAQTASVSLTMNVSPATLSISITPRRAGLTLGQNISLTATTNDYAGVTWSISPSGGTLAAKTSTDGVPVGLTAPATAGSYTVTATSITDPTQSSTASIGVTSLAGVYTYHNDLTRDGANELEYALSPSNVKAASFGKLFACTVDGAVYAQPLWVANLKMSGATRNVVFVATQHDSVFAFDADASPCIQLWKSSLIDGAHGAASGESTIPAGTTGNLVGLHFGDLTPEVGITGTPVIDPARGILYVVSKSMNSAGTRFYQRLHAINLLTGGEEAGSPVTIAGAYPGTGDGGTTVTFDPRSQNQRPGLALVNGTVYVGWGSHEDGPKFYGWLMGYTYDGSGFTQSHVFNAGPNTRNAGIWMSGSAPAADSANHLYVVTGNGVFDANSAAPPNNDYGDSFLKLSPELIVLSYFTPSDEYEDLVQNNDFGAGAVILVDLPEGSSFAHAAVAGGKDGTLFVINRDDPGGFGDGHSWQQISVNTLTGAQSTIFSTPAYWNGSLYHAGAGGSLIAYRLDGTAARLVPSSMSKSPGTGYGFPGASPSVSSMGTQNGIVWALEVGRYCTNPAPGCGPAILHAYDAANVANELWNSALTGADAAGYAVKFIVPTIANGKVYVGTRGNNTGGLFGSTSMSGELDVYGLKPN